jgi:hypothetical protein
MWGFLNAVVYACVPAALAAHLSSRPRAIVVLEGAAAAFVIAFLPAGMHALLARPDSAPFWSTMSWAQHELEPDDRVWVGTDMHPVAALDASYYWFGFADVIPLSIAWSNAHPGNGYLPPLGFEDMPLCVGARREPTQLRLVMSEGANYGLAIFQSCFLRMQFENRMKPTPNPVLFEVAR